MINRIAAIAVLAASSASLASAGMVDFEDAKLYGGDNAVIADDYFKAHGLTFTATAGVTGDDMEPADLLFEARGKDQGTAFTSKYGTDVEAPSHAGQIGDFLMTSSANNFYNKINKNYFELTIDYEEATQGVSGELWDIDGGEQYMVTAFNSSGDVVGTLTSPYGKETNLDSLPWAWSLSGDEITQVKMEFVGTSSLRGFAFDNFNARQANPNADTFAAPVPGAFWVGGVGMLALVLRRRWT